MDKFGLFVAWVGIVAFFLAIPMAVVANLATPRIQSWWATTSELRKSVRIERLNAFLLVMRTIEGSVELATGQMANGMVCFVRSFLAFLVFTGTIPLVFSARAAGQIHELLTNRRYVLDSRSPELARADLEQVILHLKVEMHAIEIVFGLFLLLILVYASIQANKAYNHFRYASPFHREQLIRATRMELRALDVPDAD
jgi:hypothetical protein